MTAHPLPEPTPTHHHGDGRRCWRDPEIGWVYDHEDGGFPLFCGRQDHPSGNAEAR